MASVNCMNNTTKMVVRSLDHLALIMAESVSDVEHNIERAEKVECITENTIVDYQQYDENKDKDELVKNEELLDNLSRNTFCE